MTRSLRRSISSSELAAADRKRREANQSPRFGSLRAGSSALHFPCSINQRPTLFLVNASIIWEYPLLLCAGAANHSACIVFPFFLFYGGKPPNPRPRCARNNIKERRGKKRLMALRWPSGGHCRGGGPV